MNDWTQEGSVWVRNDQHEAHALKLAFWPSEGAVVAFTGHRPNKLPFDVKPVLAWCLERLEALKPSKVISGMALGVDMLAAAAAVKLHIPFIAAVPFEGQDVLWGESHRETYRKLLAKAEEVVHVSDPGYEAWKMHARNHWMVDRCNLLLAVWDGTAGGTKACVEYAFKKKVVVECFSQPGRPLR